MELFAPQFDADGNLAVNDDGTLACRPLTADEHAELARALRESAAEVESAARKRKQDEAHTALHAAYRRTAQAVTTIERGGHPQRALQALLECRADLRRLSHALDIELPS